MSSARTEILAALQRTGYTAEEATELLALADKEPRDVDPDPDFRETLAGGHALIVEYGDCELIGSCQCSKELGRTTPDSSLDTFVPVWEHHSMTEVPRG
ncbi:hypothetical protein [Streptomyces sp. NPDC056549]|uniref:hypothetical protein n=1 Tax=Streptomyces sp. NPDC056549 TaxID=3345864 RepID=UPI0036C169F6